MLRRIMQDCDHSDAGTCSGPLQLPSDTPSDSTEAHDLESPRAEEPWYTPNDSEETREERLQDERLLETRATRSIAQSKRRESINININC
jgi:hypothetical protein